MMSKVLHQQARARLHRALICSFLLGTAAPALARAETPAAATAPGSSVVAPRDVLPDESALRTELQALRAEEATTSGPAPTAPASTPAPAAPAQPTPARPALGPTLTRAEAALKQAEQLRVLEDTTRARLALLACREWLDVAQEAKRAAERESQALATEAKVESSARTRAQLQTKIDENIMRAEKLREMQSKGQGELVGRPRQVDDPKAPTKSPKGKKDGDKKDAKKDGARKKKVAKPGTKDQEGAP
jgi:hypothetical protein